MSVRRQEESQDTKLLRIQNERRAIDEAYNAQKREVDQKLIELSKKTQHFLEMRKEEISILNQLEDQVKKDEHKMYKCDDFPKTLVNKKRKR